jgi:hypothetical protein
MKTLIAALAVAATVVSVSLPASANYVSPNASWVEKAFAGSGY